MQTVLSSEFKRGMVVLLDGAPHVVEDFHVTGTAQTRHKLHARLRNIKTGHVFERVFSETEHLSVAQLETRHVAYSYMRSGLHVFIDEQSFEELELSDEQLGERRWFLKENQEYKALMLDGKLLDIIAPPQIALKVVDTAPATRSGLDSAWKSAKLETGLDIMVPLFIAKGEVVRVDTGTRKYCGKET